MWPFKPKVEYRELCGEFFNTQIFSPRVEEKSRGEVYWDGAFQALLSFDPAMSSVDEKLFQLEFRAMYSELFGIAWAHRLEDRDAVLRQVQFTKTYIVSIEQQDVWVTMEAYNQAISDVADPSVFDRRQGLADRLVAQGMDPEVAGRGVNRLATEEGWKSGAGTELVATSFLTRLGLSATSWGRDSAGELANSMYEKSDSTVKSVKVVMDE